MARLVLAPDPRWRSGRAVIIIAARMRYTLRIVILLAAGAALLLLAAWALRPAPADPVFTTAPDGRAVPLELPERR
jgi:hypothetical protein